MTDKMKEAMNAVFKELKGMPREEFIKEMNACSDGVFGPSVFAHVSSNDQPMCGFGKDMWAWIKEHGEHVFEMEESEDIMEIAEKHGLAERVTYDPEIHTNIHGDSDPGDEIWWYGEGV